MAADLREITGKVWAMANQLRGTMDANEYKNYILGFLFYRYLSQKQMELIEEQNGPVPEGMSVNDFYKELYNSEDREDLIDNISYEIGYVINPEDTWESLMEKINGNTFKPDVFQTLIDNFDNNLKTSENGNKNFSGIFNDLNLGDSRLGNDVNERARSLKKVVQLIDEINPKNEEGEDLLGGIYQFLIEKFAASAGKKAGEFFTPFEVSKLLSFFVTEGWNKKDTVFEVYDATCGSGSLLLTVGNNIDPEHHTGKVRYYGQEMNTTTYNLCRMNLMMHGVDSGDMVLSNADTLGNDWPDGPDEQGIDRPHSFDAVVMNPPYSAHWDNRESKMKDPRFYEYKKLAPKTKADFAFVLHGLYHLKNQGKMAIVLPHGILFRGAAEGEIRKILLEKNYVDTVVGLPANLFFGTSIPTIILVLNKNKKDHDVLFIDASKDFQKGKNQNFLTDENIRKIEEAFVNRKDVDKFARLVPYKEIVENDYNLNIPRYVDTSEEEEEIDIKAVLQMIKQDNEEIRQMEDAVFADLVKLGVLSSIDEMRH